MTGASPRVLVVAEQLHQRVPGGIGTYVRGLAAGLVAESAASVDPVLVASRWRGEDPVDALGLVVRHLGLAHRPLLLAWDAGRYRLGRGASLVHATSFAVPPPAVPLVAMVHDLAWRVHPDAYPARGRRWHEAALARTLERSSLLMAPSEATALQLRDELGTRHLDTPVCVVEHGADHLPPPDVAGAEALLRARGIDGPFLLTVSTLEPRKNLANLLRAYGLARPRLPEAWPLLVVGPTGWGEGLERTDGVELGGQVDAALLAALYARARLVAYVPVLEGFGLPVTEAMRAGAPVVSSDVPAAGGATHLVDPSDPESIADGLVRVGGDATAHDALVVAGRRRAAPLTWRRTAAAHVVAWQQTIAPAPRR